MQPTNQSYLPEEESCFLLPARKAYRKGGLMNALLKLSPVFAYLCQVGLMDSVIDEEDFHGTIFAPCKEYCDKYWNLFNSSTIDHQRAREIVLASTLRAPMRECNLFLEPGVDIPYLGTRNAVLPTLHRYANVVARIDPESERLVINEKFLITTGDLMCTNGVIHLLTGLIEPEISI